MQTTLAIVLGLAFGVLFERYYICMNSTITDVFLFGDTRKLKGLLTTILVSAVLFNLLIGLGAIEAVPMALLPTTIFAGVVFGIGMNLAGGCVSGTLFKMGQGYVASFVAFLGVALGFGTMGVVVSFVPVEEMMPGQGTTLPMVLGVNPLLFALVVVAACLVVYWTWGRYRKRAKAEREPSVAGNPARLRVDWSSFVVGGVLVAILNAIFFVIFAHPLGLAGLTASGIAYLVNSAWALANPMFGYILNDPEYIVAGLCFLVGAFLSAVVARRFQFRLPARRQAISSLTGGFLMGVSTPMMMGCNVTHILGGVPQFGVGSLVATLGIVIGAWLGTKLVTKIVARK